MKNIKIMIVEDDFIIRMFIEKVVLDSGYDLVAKASESQEAIDLASEHFPDLILMDIGFSGKRDGIETARIIQEQQKTKIVYLTGNSDAKTIDRAKATNPAGFIFKPIDEETLRQDLEKYAGLIKLQR